MNEYSSFEVYELMNTLRHGKENAKTRKQLCAEMDINDRHLRQIIADARSKDELLIINLNDGYYLPDSYDEANRYYHREYSRAMSILHGLKPLRNAMQRAYPNQFTITAPWLSWLEEVEL